jgi:hypothetical protein
MKPATLLLLLTVTAFAQPIPKQSVTVTLANTPTEQSANEMTTILRTVADILTVSFDAGHSSFTMSATPNLLGLAEWLLHMMDKPAGWQPTAQEYENVAAREYQLQPGGSPVDDRAPAARIYYLPNNATSRDVQEVLTNLRTVIDIQKVFSITQPKMLAIRGTAASLDRAEWLIQKLDAPVGSQNPADNTFGTEPDLVQVFYLPPSTSLKTMQDLVTKLRTTAKIQKVFDKTTPPTITVRGDTALLAQAQQIVNPK